MVFWESFTGPVVKHPVLNAGFGFDPWYGNEDPTYMGQLRSCTTAREPMCCNQRRLLPQRRPSKAKKEKGRKEQLQGVREKFGGWDDIYTLIYIKLITNKDLLFSTGTHSILCNDLYEKILREWIYVYV